jgi:hypothetical protein
MSTRNSGTRLLPWIIAVVCAIIAAGSYMSRRASKRERGTQTVLNLEFRHLDFPGMVHKEAPGLLDNPTANPIISLAGSSQGLTYTLKTRKENDERIATILTAATEKLVKTHGLVWTSSNYPHLEG